MRSARAAGGSFWYSPESRVRLVTLEMGKHFLGEDAAREIWVRSEYFPRPSEMDCPSCALRMKRVVEPQWSGGYEVDVCRRCHLFLIAPDVHPEIPHPEDLLTEDGDSTVLKDRSEGMTDYLVQQEKTQTEREAILGEGPSEIWKVLPAFVGLPVEMSGSRPQAWVTPFLAMALALIQIFWVSESVIREFGFYPGMPFKNFGFNFLSSAALHGGLFHILFNLYFFLVLGDDVEEDLGKSKYTVFLLVSAVGSAFLAMVLSGSPDRPHVGLSGVVMALMAYYALQFPKARVGYFLPASINIRPGAWVMSRRWFRLPIWSIALLYVLKDLAGYFFFETQMLTQTSHAGHLGGALTGVVFWLLVSRPQKVAPVRPRF